MSRKARRFLVSGRVQGVGFRFHTCRAAQEIGLVGSVCNLDDGRVEVVTVGDEQQLSALRNFLQRGSPWARVNTVEESEVPLPVPLPKDFSVLL